MEDQSVSLGVVMTICGAILSVGAIVMPLLSMFTSVKINRARDEIMLWVEKKNSEQSNIMKEFINLKIDAINARIDGLGHINTNK
jgi:hypothetical protein